MSDFRILSRLGQAAILWSCEWHFSLGEPGILATGMLGVEEAGAWSIHGSGRILPFGAASAWYHTVVGYFLW